MKERVGTLHPSCIILLKPFAVDRREQLGFLEDAASTRYLRADFFVTQHSEQSSFDRRNAETAQWALFPGSCELKNVQAPVLVRGLQQQRRER